MNKLEAGIVGVSLVITIFIKHHSPLTVRSIFSSWANAHSKVKANSITFFMSNSCMLSTCSWWSCHVMTIIPCSRYIMIVFTLICGYYGFRIMRRPLHVFSNWATSVCAFVITPVISSKVKSSQFYQIQKGS